MKSLINFRKQRDDASKKAKKKSQFGLLQTLFRSFYDKRLYLDVRDNWRGFALRYVLLLSFLLAIPWAMSEGYKIHQYFQKTIIPCTKQLPDLVIDKGQFRFKESSPYIIKNSKGVPSIVLDNDASFDFLTKRYSQAFLIIHQDKFAISMPNMSQQVTTLDKKISGHVSYKTILKQMLDTKKLLLWALYPTMGASLFGVIAFFLFFFTLIAPFLTNVLMKYKLDYRASYRVSAVTATPGFVVMFVFYIAGYAGMALGLTTFALFYGYYLYAVHSIKNARTGLVVQEDLSV